MDSLDIDVVVLVVRRPLRQVVALCSTWNKDSPTRAMIPRLSDISGRAGPLKIFGQSRGVTDERVRVSSVGLTKSTSFNRRRILPEIIASYAELLWASPLTTKTMSTISTCLLRSYVRAAADRTLLLEIIPLFL